MATPPWRRPRSMAERPESVALRRSTRHPSRLLEPIELEPRARLSQP